jgi:peptidoglycan-N-acetylglucosamine deacetylase
MAFLMIPGAALLGGAVYYSPYAWRLACVRALRKRVMKDRILVLTYDDGPSASVTPAILELLRRYDAKATFFMLGGSAQRNSGIADRVIAEGHDAGCHSDQHLNAWKVAPWAATADINAGYDKLSRWVTPRGMFRPPYGKMTFPTYWSARRRGAPVAWWTIDSGDTRSPLPQPGQVVDRLMRDGGGIILMHDLDRSGDRNDFVLETTDRLLNAAKREAFGIKRLSELYPAKLGLDEAQSLVPALPSGDGATSF